jgi:selenocysteine lyase/cysteine desulfurase
MKTSKPAFFSAIFCILTIATTGENMTKTPMLGRHIRSQFLLDTNYTSLNHGSYGSIPKEIIPVLQDLRAKSEINPDRWLRREMFPEIDKNKATLAKLIHADPEELVFVFNAMTGINTVARSLPMEAGDKIIYVTLILSIPFSS